MKRAVKKAAQFLAFSFGDHLECHLSAYLDDDSLGEFLERRGYGFDPSDQDEIIREAYEQVWRIKQFMGIKD